MSMEPFRLDFLLCSERSGSNLITQLIGSHPEISGPSPTHMIRTVALNLQRYDFSDSGHWEEFLHDVTDLLSNQLGKWRTGWTYEELRSVVTERDPAAIIKAVYRKESEALGKKRAFVKENKLYEYAAFIVGSFSHPSFVYLVRDPRDMALSWKRSPNHSGSVIEGAQQWLKDQRQYLSLFGQVSKISNSVFVRYEDLISHPERETRRICDVLGVDYSPAMLDYHQNRETRRNASRIRNWENLARPVLAENQRKYLAALSDDEIRYIEILCAKEMAVLGYDLEFQPSEVPALAELEDTLRADPDARGAEPMDVTAEEERVRDKRIEVLNRILSRPLVVR